MKNVRIALLGSGFVADFYMQGLANVAARWSIAEPTAHLDQLIARNDIDLLLIALPNDAHLPVSLALSKAARNQVCTKPLGRNAAEASGKLHGYAETEVFAPCASSKPTKWPPRAASDASYGSARASRIAAP